MSERLDDLKKVESTELERRAREHVDGFVGELQAAADELRSALRPSGMIRRHPVGVAVLGGAATLALAALWRRRRRPPTVVTTPEPQLHEAPSRIFRKTLASGITRAVGRALPELLLLGLLRGRGGGRKRGGRG